MDGISAIAINRTIIAIAWFTTGRLLAPLRQLSDTAQMIIEADASKRITAWEPDELAELSLTVNQMLDQ